MPHILLASVRPLSENSGHIRMNLDTARSAVIAALARMNTLYNKPVFDEWVQIGRAHV